MRVVRTPRAREDLKEALTYLHRHSRPAAKRLAEAVTDCCHRLSKSPLMGRSRDDLVVGLRSVVVEQTYIIFYRVRNNVVGIVRILHGARDISGEMIAEPSSVNDPAVVRTHQ